MSIVVTLALYFIPQLHMLAMPFVLLSTFAHEMGHGVAALLVGGHFHEFRMYSDASGVALIELPVTRMATAISSAGGLLGPPIVAAILLILGTRRAWARNVLWFVAIASVLCVLWVVRSMFGVAFILSFAAVIAAVAHWGRPIFQQFTVVFIATQLGLSVFSRSDYLFTSHAQTAQGPMPSDVQNIANVLIGPYWFWGGVIALISVGILYVAIRFFTKSLLDQHGARQKKRLN